MQLEFLAKYSQIYKLFHLLQDSDIDCELYFDDDGFDLKIIDLPELKIQSKHKNIIKYINKTRTVSNLTCSKAFERIMRIIGGKNDDIEARRNANTITD